MNEKEKMEAGLWYDANYDEDLLNERLIAKDLCHEFNQLKPSLMIERGKILTQLLGYYPKGLFVEGPIICDYGKNIHLGNHVYVNSNVYFMDGASITIGNNVFIGPFCGFYTATHPLQYQYRNQGLEKALPICVGDNCWFGANVSVMPGVTIGSGCTIGAGAVVTKDIPDNSLVAGVPAKVVKTINQEEELC